MADPQTNGTGPPTACGWASRGLAFGMVVGCLLGMAEVPASVRWEGDTQRPAFRLRVLGITAFRYPEDGELYRMRPGAQVHNARLAISWFSTATGGVVGLAVGYGLEHRTALMANRLK